MERFLFLTSKFLHDLGDVIRHSTVVVDLVSCSHLRPGTEETSFKRNTLRTGTFALRKTDRGKTRRRWADTHALKLVVGMVPVAMAVGELATQPTNEVTIDEMKPEQG